MSSVRVPYSLHSTRGGARSSRTQQNPRSSRPGRPALIGKRQAVDLPADAAGYSFSAPVLKEREYRLDGLFAPPPERPDLPAVILEAQMAADPGFLLRLYAETGRFLQQRAWSGDWRVVVLCPNQALNFGRGC